MVIIVKLILSAGMPWAGSAVRIGLQKIAKDVPFTLMEAYFYFFPKVGLGRLSRDSLGKF